MGLHDDADIGRHVIDDAGDDLGSRGDHEPKYRAVGRPVTDCLVGTSPTQSAVDSHPEENGRNAVSCGYWLEVREPESAAGGGGAAWDCAYGDGHPIRTPML